MHTAKINVCNLDVFNSNFQHFWMSSLDVLQDNFSVLQTPHKNQFYTLLFVDDAVGVVQIDHRTIPLAEAKIIVIEPGCVNTINLQGKISGHIIAFSEAFFSLRYNNNILNHFGFLEKEARSVAHLSELNSIKIKSLLHLIYEEFSLHKMESAHVLRSYINIILFELERLLSTKDPVRKNDVKLEKVHAFKKLIEAHYTSQKLPSYYADLLNITPNYLNKLCQDELGATAGAVIRKHILIESQRLLRFTTLSINEITNELGFESPSYFITFFKKQVGITPEHFRKD